MNKPDLSKAHEMAQEFEYIGGLMDQNYIGTSLELDFGGESSFAGEQMTGNDFGFKITNSHPEDQEVALCPAFFSDVAALNEYGFSNVKGILKDGVIATIDDEGTDRNVIGTALDSTKKIVSLLEFIKRNPTRIVSMNIRSSTDNQFEKSIRVGNVAPFQNLGDKTIQLTDYFDPNQYQSNKIIVNLLETGNAIDFNDQNVVILTIAGGSTCTINLKVGGILNHAKSLDVRARKAYNNMARARALGRG